MSKLSLTELANKGAGGNYSPAPAENKTSLAQLADPVYSAQRKQQIADYNKAYGDAVQKSYSSYYADYLKNSGKSRSAEKSYSPYSLNAYSAYGGTSRKIKNQDINSYALTEQKAAGKNVQALQQEIAKLKTDSNMHGRFDLAKNKEFKTELAKLQQQLKDAQLDYEAASVFVNQHKFDQDSEKARKASQRRGESGIDWYNSVNRQYEEAVKSYEQAQKALKDYEQQANKKERSFSMAQGAYSSVSSEQGETLRQAEAEAKKAMEEAKKEKNFASQYRYSDLNKSAAALNLGKELAGKNSFDETMAEREYYAEAFKRYYGVSDSQWMGLSEEEQDRKIAEFKLDTPSVIRYAQDQSYNNPTQDWTAQELNTYYALWAMDRTGAEAEKYGKNLNDAKQRAKNTERAGEIAESLYREDGQLSFWKSFGKSVASIGADMLSGFEFLDDWQELHGRGEITEKGYGLSDYSSTVTGTISEGLNKQYGTLDNELAVIGGKGWGDVYNVIYSVGQSAAVAGTAAATGLGALGTNAIFFGSAAKKTLDEQLEKGVEADRALKYATLTGLNEALGETFSVERLLKLSGGQVTNFFLDTLISAGIEGTEEGVTTILNTFADHIVNGDESDYYASLASYVSQGKSYEEARKMAQREWLDSLAYDMLSGAASGGISASVGTGANEVRMRTSHLTQSEQSKLIQEGLENNVQLAKTYQKKYGVETEEKAQAQTKTQAEAEQKAAAPKADGSEEQNIATQRAEAAEQKAEGQKNNAPVEAEENTMLTDDDLDDYMKVGAREHVRNAKESIQAGGGSPILTTINAVKDFIRSSLSGGNKNKIVAYGKVGSKMSGEILSRSNGKHDVSGYYLELDGNRINHLSDHINDDSDTRNIPLTAEQAENITEYINSYDSILDIRTKKDGSARIFLSKESDNGHIVIVELISKGRRSLQPVTAWQNTKEAFAETWGKKNEASTASHSNVSDTASGYPDASGDGASPTPPEAKASKTNIANTDTSVKSDYSSSEAEPSESGSDSERKNTEADTELSPNGGNGVQRVHSDATMTLKEGQKLEKAIGEAQKKNNNKAIRDAILAELKNEGVSKNVSALRDAIFYKSQGKRIDDRQKSLIKKNNEVAQRILKELSDVTTRENFIGKAYVDPEKMISRDMKGKLPGWISNSEVKTGNKVYDEVIRPTKNAQSLRTKNKGIEIKTESVSGRIAGLDSNEKGEVSVKVKTESGEYVNVDIQEALSAEGMTDAVAQLIEYAAAGKEHAYDLFELYDGSQDILDYVTSFEQAIAVASQVSGRAIFDKNLDVEELTKVQADAAWELGREQRARDEQSVTRPVTDKKVPKRGNVSFTGVEALKERAAEKKSAEGEESYGAKLVESKSESWYKDLRDTDESKVDSEELRIIKAVAKAANVDVVFYETDTVEKGGRLQYTGANGFYIDGTVYLDVHAGANLTTDKSAILLTAAHELTHHIALNAPEQYRALKTYVSDTLAQRGRSFSQAVREKLNNDREHVKNLDGAMEEVIADACETVLVDRKSAKEIAEKNPELAGTIRTWLEEFIEKIKTALNMDDKRHAESKAVEDYMDEIGRLWGAGLKEAGKSETSSKGNVKLSQRTNKPNIFSQQIEAYKNGRLGATDTLLVGQTTEALKMIGFLPLPMTINQTHVDYALNGTKDADHYLREEGLKQIPEALEHPVAVLSSKTRQGTRLVVMLEVRQNGKQLILPVQIDGTGVSNGIRIDSNAIISAYGKNYSISKVLSDALNDEANGKLYSVYYVDIAKATRLFHLSKVPMPKMPGIKSNGFVHSITEPNSPVKRKFNSVTETQQFKRWFGDSKVVDEDGKPLVVYHGSATKGFTVFDKSKIGSATDDGLYGRGFYFSTYENQAAQYAKTDGETRSFYLTVKNPLVLNNFSNKAELAEYLDMDESQFTDNGGELRPTLRWTNRFTSALLYKGHDGVIVDHGRSDEIVVFEPTQIKSATDNIGTFDGNNPDIRFSQRSSSFAEDKYFVRQIDNWQSLKQGGYVKVGILSENSPICTVGLPKGVVSYDVSKLKKNLSDHADYLTPELVKQIPQILNNPMAISEYSPTTASVFGEVIIGKSPVMVGLTISKNRAGTDITKIHTFNIRRDAGSLLTDDKTLYLNENKKETRKWFQACGIQVPLGGTQFGFIRSLTHAENDVNPLFSRRAAPAAEMTDEEIREQNKAFKRLSMQYATLETKLRSAKREFQKTGTIAPPNKVTVGKFAEKLIGEYNSTADRKTVTELLYRAMDYFSGNDTVNEEGFTNACADVMELILKDSSETGYPFGLSAERYGELMEDLKGYKLYFDKRLERYIPGNYRSQTKDSMKLSTEEKHKGSYSSVNTVYEELQAKYGEELFPKSESEARMLNQIIDMASSNPTLELPYELQTSFAEVLEGQTYELMDEIMRDALKRVGMTKSAGAKFEKQRDNYEQRMDRIRNDNRRRQDALKKEGSLRAQEARAKEKAEKWKKVEEVKKFYQEQAEAAKLKRIEAAAVTKHRYSVLKKAQKLQELLISNSQKKHVPEELKEPLGEFLSWLDYRSKSALRDGEKRTQADVSIESRLNRIADILDKQAKYLQGQGQESGTTEDSLDMLLDVPPDFAQFIREHSGEMQEILGSEDSPYSSDPIMKMNSIQLEYLNQMLTVLDKSIRTVNEFKTNSHFAGVIEAAHDSVTEMHQQGAQGDRLRPAESAENFLLWQNGVPVYVFKRFGKAGVERFTAVREGWGKLAKNVKAAIDFTEDCYTRQEVRDWEEHVNEIGLEDGSSIKITDAQIMSLAALMRRDNGVGQEHILVGGIRIEDTAAGKWHTRHQNETFHPTLYDMGKMLSKLDERQMEVVVALQKFMTEQGGAWGNEISMERFGYRQYTEKNYFPIRTDSNNRPVQNLSAQENDIMRLLNMSFTKALTPHANNSVIINSIFDVYASHVGDMAKYNALALPVLDILKWYNAREKTNIMASDGSQQIRADSVQQTIFEVYGRNGQNYFLNFMRDLNGTREGGRGEGGLQGVMGKVKAVSVAANLRVAIQQGTSIARAAYVINPEYLARGAAMKGGVEKALEHSGLALWKSLGYFDVNVARDMRAQIKGDDSFADRVLEKGSSLAEKMDEVTWGALWNACEIEQAEKTGKTGEELMELTRLRFDDLIMHTQVMDSTITRSDIMRSKSTAVKELTAFKSEPTLTWNMLAESISDYQRELRTNGGDRLKAIKTTFPKAFKAAVVFTTTAAFTSMAAAVIDALRDDDEYESLLEKWLEHFKENFIDNVNPAQLIAGVADLYEVLTTGKAPQNLMWTPVTQASKAWESLGELWNNWTKGEEPGSGRTNWGYVYDISNFASSLSGLPAASGLREFKALYNLILAPLIGKKIKFYDPGTKNSIKYALQDGYLSEEEAARLLVETGEYDKGDDAYWAVQGWVNAEEEDWDKYNALFTASQNGDKAAYNEALDALEEHGIANHTAQNAIKSRVKRLYEDTESAESITREKAEELLTQYAGLSQMQAEHELDKWSVMREYGFEYTELKEQYVAGEISAEEAESILKSKGHVYEQDAKEKLREWNMEKATGYSYDELSNLYISGQISGKEAANYLSEYGQLSPTAADSKVLQWQLAKDYGISYGSSTEGIKAALIQGYITEQQAVEIMMYYGGKTQDEAEDYMYQYLFTKETGYGWSDADKAYADGKLSFEELVYWYQNASIYSHGSYETAVEYARVADWKAGVEGAEKMNRTGLEKWDKNESRIRSAGLNEADFAYIWQLYNESESQYDAEGKQYKPKAQVFFEKLAKTGYSKEQKNALGRAISKSGLNKYRSW